MDITIHPKKLHGNIRAIPSKSQAHRLLICSAFADRATTIVCPQTNQDIEATAECLVALGANIERTANGYLVQPATQIPQKATLNCRESGSTLRFLLPVVGALGVEGTFLLEGRLPQRPLSPLWEEMERMGCSLRRPTLDTIACSGQLMPGNYSVMGNVSSQYITGLLFAMTLMNGDSALSIIGKLESRPYVDMTLQALSVFGINASNFSNISGSRFRSPGTITVEGDWSNGAFFLAANKLGNDITVSGLGKESKQGDHAVVEILQHFDSTGTVDAADIPDLVPILAITAGALHGAVFHNVSRLRLKESDRVATVSQMLKNLGITAIATENTLQVLPGKFTSCTIDSHGDHRIAMAAAIAATIADGPVTILGAECVSKSYPSFWEEYHKLGGYYEQYIR